MRMRQLQCFVVLAEELNFTRAAQRLNMSQPPLSTQIQTLERELGAELISRTSRKVVLTRAGELFFSGRATCSTSTSAASWTSARCSRDRTA